MSKIVVGMKSRPAITPHRIDCGLRKTSADARRRRSRSQSPASCARVPCCGSSRNKSSARSTSPATPIRSRSCSTARRAAIIGPTTNWPAEPPAMPNICVAPIRVAARDAGKVRGRDVDGADQREDAAGALQKPPDARRASRLPVANSSAPTPTAAAPIGTTLARPEPVQRHAGDQAERRVAVVEEARPATRRAAASMPNASDSSGIITAGAERSVYW